MITEMLNALSEIQGEFDLLRQDYQAERDEILRAVKDELDALDSEFNPKFDAARENMDNLTEAIKVAVIEQGATVKGAHLMAVYAKGRVSWDTKALDGYAMAHPELLAARKEGQPSVSIRSV